MEAEARERHEQKGEIEEKHLAEKHGNSNDLLVFDVCDFQEPVIPEEDEGITEEESEEPLHDREMGSMELFATNLEEKWSEEKKLPIQMLAYERKQRDCQKMFRMPKVRCQKKLRWIDPPSAPNEKKKGESAEKETIGEGNPKGKRSLLENSFSTINRKPYPNWNRIQPLQFSNINREGIQSEELKKFRKAHMTDKGENLAGSVQTKQTEPTELNGGMDGTLTAAADGGLTELDVATAARRDPAAVDGGGIVAENLDSRVFRDVDPILSEVMPGFEDVESEEEKAEDPVSVLKEPEFKDYRATALIDNGKFEWFFEKGFKAVEMDSEEISDEEFNSDSGSLGSWESEKEDKPDSVYFGKFDFARAIGMKKEAGEGSSACKERRLPVEGPVKPLYSFTIDMDNIPERFKPNWPLDEKLWSSDVEDEENLEKKGEGNKKEGKRTHEPP